jgi:hypothetical protein
LAKLVAYDEEWKQLFDKAEIKAEQVFQKTTGKLTKTPKMIVLQRLLRFVERQLTLKYGSEEVVDLPKSEKAWSKLSERFGDNPILVAKRQDNGKIILVLMDQFGQQ